VVHSREYQQIYLLMKMVLWKGIYGSHTASHIPLNEVILFSKS